MIVLFSWSTSGDESDLQNPADASCGCSAGLSRDFASATPGADEEIPGTDGGSEREGHHDSTSPALSEAPPRWKGDELKADGAVATARAAPPALAVESKGSVIPSPAAEELENASRAAKSSAASSSTRDGGSGRDVSRSGSGDHDEQSRTVFVEGGVFRFGTDRPYIVPVRANLTCPFAATLMC